MDPINASLRPLIKIGRAAVLDRNKLLLETMEVEQHRAVGQGVLDI